MSETEKDNRIWGVVHSGVLTFLGAFCDYHLVAEDAELPKGDAGRELQEEAFLRIERDIENGKFVRLEPVMELAAPLQQVRQQTPMGERAGVAKSPLPMPYGFTTGKTKLRVRPDAIAFINEMTAGDQRMYRSFIETVIKAEEAERAGRAGIELATTVPGSRRV